jgi:hypothetical protein
MSDERVVVAAGTWFEFELDCSPQHGRRAVPLRLAILHPTRQATQHNTDEPSEPRDEGGLMGRKDPNPGAGFGQVLEWRAQRDVNIEAGVEAYGVTDQGELAERMVTVLLRPLRFTIAQEPLDSLQAFLIAENGHRRVVVNAHLPPWARVYYCLHCVGHVAMGHVGDDDLSIRFEVPDRTKLPADRAVEEAEADRWVRVLVDKRVHRNGRVDPFMARSLRYIHRVLGHQRNAEGERVKQVLTDFGNVLTRYPDLAERLLHATEVSPCGSPDRSGVDPNNEETIKPPEFL